MSQRAQLLKNEFDWAKTVFDMTVGDLTEEVATRRVSGANINPILPIYAHVVFGLDAMTNQVAAGGEPLLLSDGWGERTGITQPGFLQTPEWGQARYNLDGLRQYSEAVFGSLNSYLDRATDADLDREFPSPLGGQQTNVARFLGGIGVVHLSGHTGEIAALKGIHGLQGLPF